MSEIIDSDIIDLAGREVWVTVYDEADEILGGAVTVTLLDRGQRVGPVTALALALSPDDAHQLGNKLRLAARKRKARHPQPSD